MKIFVYGDLASWNVYFGQILEVEGTMHMAQQIRFGHQMFYLSDI